MKEVSLSNSGFDVLGGPHVQVMDDGRMVVRFNSIPPSDLENFGDFFVQHFRDHLSEALGVNVVWEDREVFHITETDTETLTRLGDFLRCYRQKHSLPAASVDSKQPVEMLRGFRRGQMVYHSTLGKGRVVQLLVGSPFDELIIDFGDGELTRLNCNFITGANLSAYKEG